MPSPWIRPARLVALGALLLVTWARHQGRAETPAAVPQYRPEVAPASEEALAALERVKLPPGMQIELLAAEPLLANPVAFAFDEAGRVLVVETHRLHSGVTDNRLHMEWLDADLAARTVEDRLAMYQKFLGQGLVNYTQEHDRLRLLEDRDGDGRYEHATVYADGFQNAVDGIAAGVLARGGQVYFACIPDLWLLRDDDHDGQADHRQSLHTGYGVHVSFLGHDLHGLRIGPDGKLYFSIGDRGFHVTTPEGTLDYPDEGAVLRCNLDGSALEVVHRGLRNPQELAFDELGNLFTGDNNSDGGDKARWVYVVEGGDSAWRIGYQYLTEPNLRGPWNAEKLWVPRPESPAQWHNPPLANLGDGPSGLAYYPGSGLPPEYQGHFFLCDFRGASLLSGIRTFRLTPQGASFAVTDFDWFVRNLLATDVDFGPGGGLTVSDWVEGWEKPKKGRLERIFDPRLAADPLVEEVRSLLTAGFGQRSNEALIGLLTHADQRVRQEAQFALAARGAKVRGDLEKRALDASHRLARLHALWALGQQAASEPAALAKCGELLEDDDPELRAHAARLLGDHGQRSAGPALVARLRDPVARVRYFAAQSLGKLKTDGAAEPILELVRNNDDADVYLRHAAVVALARLDNQPVLTAAAADSARSVRLAALLAWRRQGRAEVGCFLQDSDSVLVSEAARAIYDVPIPGALSQLAALVATERALPEPVWRRAINAAYRLGGSDQAAALVERSLNPATPEPIRQEALDLLLDWTEPGSRDRVLGHWRPLAARPVEQVRQAVAPRIESLLASGAPKLQARAARLAGQLKLEPAGVALLALAKDSSRSSDARQAALVALQALEHQSLRELVGVLVDDKNAEVRALALEELAVLDPAEALPRLTSRLAEGKPRDQQAALATLARMKPELIEPTLIAWLDRLLEGQVPAEIQLDLLEAAALQSSPQVRERLHRYEAARPADDPLAPYRETLSGGSAIAGRKLFFERAELSCLRCHHVKGEGGAVGPELSRIASQKDRVYLLESIVAPNRQIAQGFGSVVLATDDGRALSGVLRSEDDERLELITAEGKLVVVPKASIEERTTGPSAMPEKLHERLTKRELRDLVEYLSTLR